MRYVRQLFVREVKKADEDGRWITVNGRAIFIAEGQSVEDAVAKRDGGKDGDKKKNESDVEVYHATAEGYAQSIMKDGLQVSKAGKGMSRGVYSSTEQGEAFHHGTQAAIDEFQKGVRSGKYKQSDSDDVKVFLIVADKSKFPESAYKDLPNSPNTIFKSKSDIPSSCFKRTEIYRYKDADNFSKRYSDAKYSGKTLPTMPLPSPIKTVGVFKKENAGGDLYLCLVSEIENKEANK